MKQIHYKRHSNSAFTLIELLVVITIIAILAGLVISQAPKLMQQSRELEIRNVITGLKTGIGNYQVEYNRFPIKTDQSSGSEDATAILTDSTSTIVGTLMGEAGRSGDEADPLNPKGIQFCDFKMAKNGRNGLVNAKPPYGLVDLWGIGYSVRFDTNLDRKIENPDVKNQDPKISQSTTNPPPQNLPTDVIIFSNGLDMKPGTGDDIVSWRQ